MPAAASITVNARVTAFAMGGQQRVAAEILRRLPEARALMPKTPLGGLRGHLWEQAALPVLAAGSVLWSPSATGPLFHRRQVVTVHDTAFIDVPEFFTPSFVKLYRHLVPRLVRRATRVVTVSRFSRKRLAEFTGLPEDRIDVIANGVTSNFHPRRADERAATSRALNLPSRYILLQATSDGRKNLARAMDAWRLAAPDLPADLHLVVSGNLGRAHVFGGVAADLAGPRVRVVGFVDDAHLGPLMAGAEAFLFPSLYEGFGLPVIEAMASGVPVITGDATALPEVAGDAAFLVNARSTTAIAGALARIAVEPAMRETLARRGLARAAAFTWESAAEQYRAIFSSVARASSPGPIADPRDLTTGLGAPQY
jgi:glycosyltransferase involved in cell wall biosynthesis